MSAKPVVAATDGSEASLRSVGWAAREAASGLVTLDMGGTSADIAFIEGGAPLEVTEGVIARRQVDVPALDLTTTVEEMANVRAQSGQILREKAFFVIEPPKKKRHHSPERDEPPIRA